MKVGDCITCWTYKEMAKKEFELLKNGVWTERDKNRANTLVVTCVRNEDGENDE